MAESEEYVNKASALAKDIMSLASSQLLVNFRYLDRAVSHLDFVPDEDFTLETDGASVFFSPFFILSQYKAEQSVIARDLLHSLLHCVFCHSFIGREVDPARWDLACDIAVENAINELGAPCVRSSRELKQAAATDLLKSEIGTLTAEKIYRWLREKEIPEDELVAERESFKGDGHGLWYGSDDPEAKQNKNVKLRKIWEEVSRRMQTELELMKRENGALVQNLKSLNRSRRSYTDFLRRFAVHGEVMRLSDEEFDNNYYIYGLDTYGNIPLIEPLEYTEQRRIREFIIAIDTSGSVKGDVVQSFIQHTYDILSKQESFFTKVNMYILQCDCAVRDAAHITCREDFEDYIKNLEIKGLGETDFRPVFEFAAEKIRKRELTDLKGLLYFTDGLGTFPSEKPPYDTAFILHRGDYDEPPVPDWAMSMTLSEEDILDRRFSS